MTQSKKSNDIETTINIDELDLDDLIDMNDSITINLDDTYGSTTTYWAGDNITDININSISNDSTFTIDANTINTVNTDWLNNDTFIYPSEVERMCEEYPALEKVWRNFKSIYDMIKQDYEGKKKAGEIDDDFPF